jgi:hypothetical protein
MAWWTTCSSKEGYATSHKQRHCNAKEEERLSCCWKMIGILCVLMWRRLRKEVCVWLFLYQMYLSFQSTILHLPASLPIIFPSFFVP